MAQVGAYICDNINEVVNILQGFKNIDSVINVYIVPSAFVKNDDTSGDYNFGQNAPVENQISIEKLNNIDGYIPKNNKMFNFPYCYLSVSNNNGTSNNYNYELFSTENCNFNIKGVPVIGASIKCNPKNYKYVEENEEEGIVAGKFPTLSWSADEFTNWLTQNAVNIGVGLTSAVITSVGSAITGNPAIIGGAVASGALNIASQLGQIYEHSLTPNSARGNTNAGDINITSGTNTFYFYQMSIKREFAKIIDDFFTIYGYKVNEIKVPDIKTRSNWNYLKVIEPNIIAEIPQEDLQEIKDILSNGVTFWHNPNTFLDYSQENI